MSVTVGLRFKENSVRLYNDISAIEMSNEQAITLAKTILVKLVK